VTTRHAEAAAHGTSLAAGDRMSMLLVHLISVISHARSFSEGLLETRLAMQHHKQCFTTPRIRSAGTFRGKQGSC